MCDEAGGIFHVESAHIVHQRVGTGVDPDFTFQDRNLIQPKGDVSLLLVPPPWPIV